MTKYYSVMKGWTVPMFQVFLWLSVGFIFPDLWLSWWFVVLWGCVLLLFRHRSLIFSLGLGLGFVMTGALLHHTIPPLPMASPPFLAEGLLNLKVCQKESSKGSRWIAEVVSGNLRPGKQVMLYLPSGMVPKPTSGDVWAVQGKATFPAPVLGQGFRPDRWLHEQQCAFSFRVKEPCYAVWKGRNKPDARSYWRQWWRSSMQHPWLDSLDKGFLQALMLGDKSELPPELQAQFSKAGLSHILAVSGMHVGLVFIVVAFGVKFLPPHKLWSRWVKFIFPVVFVWGFVWLSGMGASALRAGLMCSLLQLGLLFNRPVQGLNMLGWAGCLLVAFEPAFWATPGFQLSFLAVWGLLVWVKPFSAILPKGPLKKWGAGIPVALAAQWATTPISIYYFGQFPLYFLFTNLCAVPLVTGILYLAMGSITLTKLGLTLPFLYQILHYGIQGLMWVATWPEYLPVGAITGLVLSPLETLVTTACLLYLSWKKHLWVWMSMAWLFWVSSSFFEPKVSSFPISFVSRGREGIEIRAGDQRWMFSHEPALEKFPLPMKLSFGGKSLMLTGKWNPRIHATGLAVIWLGEVDFFPDNHHGWLCFKDGVWFFFPPPKNHPAPM